MDLFNVVNTEDRHSVMTGVVNLKHRCSRLQEYMASFLSAAGDVNTIQIEIARVETNLTKKHAIITAVGVISRHGDDNSLVSALDYPLPEDFLLLPSDIDSWDPVDPWTHLFSLHFLCQ